MPAIMSALSVAGFFNSPIQDRKGIKRSLASLIVSDRIITPLTVQSSVDMDYFRLFNDVQVKLFLNTIGQIWQLVEDWSERFQQLPHYEDEPTNSLVSTDGGLFLIPKLYSTSMAKPAARSLAPMSSLSTALR